MILRRLILPAAIGLAMPFLLVSAASAAVKHVVSPGETLSYIAIIYETTVEEIAGENGIVNPDVIFPGQGLDIPGAGGDGPTGSGGGESYVVQPGDTLSGIAYDLGVSTAQLQAANGIGYVDYIYGGQVLTVPKPNDPAPVAPTLLFPERPRDPGLESMMEEIAWMEGVDPGLVKAVATVESGWAQWAYSSAGAIGIMQVMPGTVFWLETDVFGFDLHEQESAWDNVRLGTRYLRILLDATGFDGYDAVAAYYQGLSPTEAGVYYAGTADYASMVLAVKAAYWP
jgi:LysM repeat protein